MSYLRFNHVFVALMALSFLSAFILKPSATDRLRAQVQNIFAPIAWPVNGVAARIDARFGHHEVRDDGSPKVARTSADLIIENQQLRAELTSLKSQLDRLAQREHEREGLGKPRNFCTAFNVIAGDSGPRDSLLLSATSLDGLQTGMAVISTGGIVGKISRAGVGGASVLLITDPQSKFTAKFIRFGKKSDGTPDPQPISSEPSLVQGAGNGMLVSRIMKKSDSELHLQAGDWAVLSDSDWREELDGYPTGYIFSVTPSKDPGFVDVKMKPFQNLKTLREVMVMNKG
jgi:cell shape-determining protein MreC